MSSPSCPDSVSLLTIASIFVAGLSIGISLTTILFNRAMRRSR